MRLKVDENLPASVAHLLRTAGHEAETGREEALEGAPDSTIAAVARQERRALIALDTDFGNISVYDPAAYPGIIVLRPESQAVADIRALVVGLLAHLDEASIAGHLWIVEGDRIRVRPG